MSSEPQKESSAGKERLPFEPKKNRKKTAKAASVSTVAAKNDQPQSVSQATQAIPEVVSQRMIRRMAIFCGIPTALGITTFIVSYFVISNAWFELPNAAVLIGSIGFFGLGALGLSYGVLSASWEEETAGSWWGWEQFTVNWGRMTAAWRSSKQKD